MMEPDSSPFRPVNLTIPARKDEHEVDLIEVARKIWSRRRKILIGAVIGAVVGLILAFTLPRSYTTYVKMSPESRELNKLGQLSGVASMFGVNLGNGSSGSDAITVEMYPDIVHSTPFLMELIGIPVVTRKGQEIPTLYEYLEKEEYPGNLEDRHTVRSDSLLVVKLSPKETHFLRLLEKQVAVSVDKKSGVITASVSLRDPEVSAQVMQVIIGKLQDYITDYRTRKARHDLRFAEKLYDESRNTYYSSLKRYAEYTDENKNVVKASYRTGEERLRNEMSVAYTVYSQMAQQLEMNKIKVQEQTPVFAVIDPPTVPLKADKPRKMVILIGFILLGGVLPMLHLFVNEVLKKYRNDKTP